jgi:predicted nucleic acid-binding Zn ribbon protein
MSDKLEAECPDCGAKLRFTLDDVAKQRSVRCSSGHSVELQDEGGGARKAAKSLSDLDKTLKRFGKR